jgi:hypothetical protein
MVAFGVEDAVEEEEEEEMVAFGVEDAVEEEEYLPAVGKCKYHDKRNNTKCKSICCRLQEQR